MGALPVNRLNKLGFFTLVVPIIPGLTDLIPFREFFIVNITPTTNSINMLRLCLDEIEDTESVKFSQKISACICIRSLSGVE